LHVLPDVEMDERQKSFPSNKQYLLFEGKRYVCQGFPGITGFLAMAIVSANNQWLKP